MTNFPVFHIISEVLLFLYHSPILEAFPASKSCYNLSTSTVHSH